MATNKEITAGGVILPVTHLDDATALDVERAAIASKYGFGVNLLDNWYFANPINQRGLTTYTGSEYTVDRWGNWFNNADCSLKILDDSILLTMGALSPWNNFAQKIEYFPAGTYTLSFLVDNYQNANQIYVGGISANLYFQTNLLSLTFSTTEKKEIVEFGIQPKSNTQLKVYAAKLELGTRQTLAHQDADGNWVLNDPPPNYALELAKCQSHQIELNPYRIGYCLLCYGQGWLNGTEVDFFAPTPVTMRANPNVSNYDKWYAVDISNDTWHQIQNIAAYAVAGGIKFITTVDSAEAGKIYALMCKSTGDGLFADANPY